MRNIYTYMLLTAGFFLAQNTQAQTLSNANLDSWTPSGSPPPFDWEEPTGWQSNNATVEFSGAAITKSTTAQSGPFSAQVKTVNIFGTNVPGLLTNGNAPLHYASYSLKLTAVGTPYTAKPLNLNGFYRYTTTATDSALVICLLKKWNSGLNKADTIGIGIRKLLPAASFQSFSSTINYTSMATPDSVAIYIYSSIPATAQLGSVLLIDNLSLSGFSGVNELSTPHQAVSAYPNPTSGRVSFTVPDEYASHVFDLAIFDASGKTVMHKNQVRGNEVCEIDLPAGVYQYRLNNADQAYTGTGRLTIAR